jgi:hypothetical protein
VPPVEGPKRVPKRNATSGLRRANVVEAQGESRGRDTAQDCSLRGQLVIAVDLPVTTDRTDPNPTGFVAQNGVAGNRGGM